MRIFQLIIMKRAGTVLGLLLALIVATAAMIAWGILRNRKKAMSNDEGKTQVEGDSVPVAGYALFADVDIVGKGMAIDFFGYYATVDEARKRCDSLATDACHYITHKKIGSSTGYYVYGIRGVPLSEVGSFVVRNPDRSDVYMRLN
jgi:hypothetical protein